MFGTCKISIDRKRIEAPDVPVAERRVRAEDIPALAALWEAWFGDIDLAVVPEDSVLDWISVNIRIHSSTLLIGGEIAGYVRYEEGHPDKIKSFLARDRQAAQAHLRYMNSKIADKAVTEVELPVHPEAAAVRQMIPYPYQSEIRPWDAAMIHILDPGCIPIVKYCEEISRGARSPGLLLWPVEFDIV